MAESDLDLLSYRLAGKVIDWMEGKPDYTHYSGYVSFDNVERYRVQHGICQYKNGKKNGMGYDMSYYQEIPLGTLYEAGEYEDDKLKNGIRISNDGDQGITLVMYELKNFEQTRLYPKE